MTWYHWLIVVLPILFVIGMGIYSMRFIRGVADFLAAGRVAGRYVLSVSALEGGLAIITLIATTEANYQTGFAMTFWNNILLPLGMILSLSGFVNYRLRETKVLSMGQFLEMRYSRSFRVFSMFLRTFSEILCNCIGPAVTARFFIYLLGLPNDIYFMGVPVPTFLLLVIGLLILANILVLSGGTISLLVTDCIQGLMCYPMFVIFTVFMLTEFSWFNEITPVMADRISGESFLNPYDIKHLRDFNLFALFVTLLGRVINVGVWFGGGASSAAKNAHKQKMMGILSTYRTGFSIVMTLMLAVVVITFMNHENFAERAHKTRVDLITQVAKETLPDKKNQTLMIESVSNIAQPKHKIGVDKPLSRMENPDIPYLNTAHNVLKQIHADNSGEANSQFQQFRSLYNQMMMPAAFRNLLTPFLLSLFVLLGVMLMISTDSGRIFSSSMTIAQDLVLPFLKKPLTPKQHIALIRWMTILVSIIFMIGSLYLAQMDYINLFCIISTSIWIGGAGSVLTFGLYSRRGTTAGAYAAILTGAFISGGGILLQWNWADIVYPYLNSIGWIPALGTLLHTVSAPFNPYIVWEMDAIKFPINSNELLFIAMTASMAMYWIVSFLSFKKLFNLDRMLHRGVYNTDGENKQRSPFTWKTVLNYFVNITPEYTKGDKIITWSVFSYSFVFQFLICFVGIAVWNIFSPWPIKWWSWNFFITSLLIPSLLGVISTVWFFIGGVIDMKALFRDLALRKDDPLDNGQVEGEVALSDIKKFSSNIKAKISSDKT